MARFISLCILSVFMGAFPALAGSECHCSHKCAHHRNGKLNNGHKGSSTAKNCPCEKGCTQGKECEKGECATRHSS